MLTEDVDVAAGSKSDESGQTRTGGTPRARRAPRSLCHPEILVSIPVETSG